MSWLEQMLEKTPKGQSPDWLSSCYDKDPTIQYVNKRITDLILDPDQKSPDEVRQQLFILRNTMLTFEELGEIGSLYLLHKTYVLAEELLRNREAGLTNVRQQLLQSRKDTNPSDLGFST